jgi:hypothetical protein
MIWDLARHRLSAGQSKKAKTFTRSSVCATPIRESLESPAGGRKTKGFPVNSQWSIQRLMNKLPEHGGKTRAIFGQ